jgi:hypothetical protein
MHWVTVFSVDGHHLLSYPGTSGAFSRAEYRSIGVSRIGYVIPNTISKWIKTVIFDTSILRIPWAQYRSIDNSWMSFPRRINFGLFAALLFNSFVFFVRNNKRSIKGIVTSHEEKKVRSLLSKHKCMVHLFIQRH